MAQVTHSPSPLALFRYQLTVQLLERLARGIPCPQAVHQLASQHHLDPRGEHRRVSARSLYRWLAAYQQHGFEGLERAPRTTVERSAVVPGALLDFLDAQKALDPDASLPELLRRAAEHGVISPNQHVDRTTVYRAAKRMGLPVARRKRRRRERDTRRFAYAHRMQMTLCDGKHFRAGAHRARRVALFFLDDATRYALHVVVGTSESAELFLRGLYQAIRAKGLADAYYLDQGPGFIALDTAAVLRNLNALLIHGEAAYPEGHGKIERFNQTALNDLLRGFDGRPGVDPTPAALELRVQHYLRESYNQRVHESLDGCSPAGRFHADTRPLQLPPSDHQLRQHFVLTMHRTVTADHIVSVDSVHYEVPTGHAGQVLHVHRNLLDNTLAIVHNQRLVNLAPVDLHANARARRARTPKSQPTRPPLPNSAADLAFERDLAPVVDRHGGFNEPPPE